jgi:hypothetical protein
MIPVLQMQPVIEVGHLCHSDSVDIETITCQSVSQSRFESRLELTISFTIILLYSSILLTLFPDYAYLFSAYAHVRTKLCLINDLCQSVSQSVN